MRGITQASAYLPAYTDGTRRVAAQDEDAFTLLVTAFERVLPRTAASPAPIRLRVLGCSNPPDPAALSAALGAPVELVPSGPSPDPLRGVLASAVAESGPSWVAVVADPDAAPASPAPGDGAAVLLIDDAPRPVGVELSGSTTPSPLSELFERVRRSTSDLPRVGDWAAEPARGLSSPSPRTSAKETPSAVSQGAYVPLAADVANRPSRWRFVGQRCGSCGTRNFPARGRCRACGRRDRLNDDPLSLDGAKVVATTWIGAGGQPTEFDAQVATSGPYGVVLAEIAPGIRVTLTVADAQRNEVEIGSRVDTRFRRLYAVEGAWRYGRKAVPARRTAE